MIEYQNGLIEHNYQAATVVTDERPLDITTSCNIGTAATTIPLASSPEPGKSSKHCNCTRLQVPIPIQFRGKNSVAKPHRLISICGLGRVVAWPAHHWSQWVAVAVHQPGKILMIRVVTICACRSSDVMWPAYCPC